MKSTTLRRTGLAALALTMSMGMAACGSDDSSESSSSSAPKQESMPKEEAAGAADGTFGPACSAIPKSGAGSFQGMSTAPVATAASANPVLKTLVTAVGAAGLVDTLNSAPELTVFAPANDAFAAIPKKDLNAPAGRQARADQGPDAPRRRGQDRSRGPGRHAQDARR